MSEKSFEYFHDEVIITGKHKEYVDALWKQNTVEESFFKRLLDLYMVAAVVGLRSNKKAPLDNLGEKRTIQVQQLLHSLKPLNTIMTLVLLLDESEGLSKEQKIDRAFRKPETEEEFKRNVELFNSYVRGGIEYLYDALVIRVLDVQDEVNDVRVGNMLALLNDDFEMML